MIMACKAYRNYAKKERGVTEPNIVMSVSKNVVQRTSGERL